jgi:GGDEF domain-containing protein
MAKFDLEEVKALGKRENQLLVLSAVFVMVLAGGVALLMYPTVFLHPEDGSKWTMQIAFTGFCALTILFVVYLFDRQLTVHKLKQHLIEQIERNAELRNKANVDLLDGLGDVDRFHDQLAMEFPRAVKMQKPLSLLGVKVKVARNLVDETETAAALGEVVKGIARALRSTDSLYALGKARFGALMPEASIANVKLVELKIEQTLKLIGAAGRFDFEITTCNYPKQVQTALEMEDFVASLLPQE